MSERYNGTKRLMVAGEVVTQTKFIEALLAQNKSLTDTIVRLGLARAQLGDQDWPTEITEDQKNAVLGVEKIARESYAAVEVFLKNKKQAEVDAAAKRDSEKKKWTDAYHAAEPSEALVRPLANLVEQSVALALGDHFVMKNGDITLKKDADPYESFGTGFRNLNELFSKSTEMQQGFAIYEAKLCLAAKKELGDNWPVALAGADKKDIFRIKKNMAGIVRFQSTGYAVGDVPIGTIRTLTEVTYGKDEAENSKGLKSAVKKFFEASKKKGSMLNQIEARELVNKLTPERKAKQIWTHYYIIPGGLGKAPKVVGSLGLDDRMFDQSLVTIEKAGSCVVLRGPDGYIYEPIPAYAGEASERALERQEAPVAKPAPEPVAGPPEANVVPFTPPEDEPAPAIQEDELDLDSIFAD